MEIRGSGMNEALFTNKIIKTYGKWPTEIIFGCDEQSIRKAMNYHDMDSVGALVLSFLQKFIPSEYLHIGHLDLLDLEGLKYYNSKFPADYKVKLDDWRAIIVNDAAVPVFINMKNGRVAMLEAVVLLNDNIFERPLGDVLFQQWTDFDTFMEAF
jgi:hypothetical protein